jgi:hypothetical protein
VWWSCQARCLPARVMCRVPWLCNPFAVAPATSAVCIHVQCSGFTRQRLHAACSAGCLLGATPQQLLPVGTATSCGLCSAVAACRLSLAAPCAFFQNLYRADVELCVNHPVSLHPCTACVIRADSAGGAAANSDLAAGRRLAHADVAGRSRWPLSSLKGLYLLSASVPWLQPGSADPVSIQPCGVAGAVAPCTGMEGTLGCAM